MDCLCDYYKVQPYTEEFYKYFESFVSNATRHRQNMLLIPAFTPPLDTVKGGERRNVQLVDVTVTDNGYVFGFERLKKYLDTAIKCGVKYFEHCHLFSQWGAESAPNIYDIDGKRIFGWDTPSDGEKYMGFLTEYLTRLLEFARENDYEKRFVFHLSDEPSVKHIEKFRSTTDGIRGILKGFKIIDALSNIEFYNEGFVTCPIPVVYEFEKFYGKCDELWIYYTGAVYKDDYSNRLITNTAPCTRVLGLQMYRYDVKGFLHWAYNFYYNMLSRGYFDPLVNPCGYKNYPGVKTFVLTPIWRPNYKMKTDFESFFDVEKGIRQAVADKENMIVIPGFDLLPHDETLFADQVLHPNDEGFSYYFENLWQQVKKYI